MAYTEIDDPSVYFQIKLYTAADAYTFDGNSDMQPDWMWIKERNGTNEHNLFDSVRGTTKRLETSTTAAEQTSSTTLTAFGSDGFTVGNNPGTGQNGSNYAAWGWKAGTSVSGNTTGSGTAKAYTGSVNTDSGFSIIKYIGNGAAGHTIPHHLGAVPKMMIIKRIDAVGGSAGLDAWMIYHQALGNTNRLIFTDAATDAEVGYFNNTTPTSSVFTLGVNNAGNNTDYGYIAYSFAEKQGYSKFGSYTGNDNANGPFVYLGFKPAWIMIKRTDTENTSSNMNGSHWVMLDNKRDTINTAGAAHALTANRKDAEDTSNLTNVDFLSNGFKFRGGADAVNASAAYVFMAFAENPFVTSTGIPATAR